MKTISLFLVACIIFSLNSFGQDFKKLKDSEINKSKVKIAQDFASEFLTKLKSGEIYQFQNEAIDAVKNTLSGESQRIVYQQLKEKYGDFKLLEYAETWIKSGNSSLCIIRFKSDFEKSNKKLEVRVVLNDTDKIAGFFIKPWSDMLQ